MDFPELPDDRYASVYVIDNDHHMVDARDRASLDAQRSIPPSTGTTASSRATTMWSTDPTRP